jgi:dTMP kinase
MFIVFEGGDGAGKSTQVAQLNVALLHDGQRAVVTREPGGTLIGHKLRTLLLSHPDGPCNAKTEALMFAADRAHHVDTVIAPALAAGQHVICDRYADSTIAYQGYGRGLNRSMLTLISRWATDELQPDLTVLLDIDPRVGLARATQQTVFEEQKLDFHTRVRQGFLALAAKNPARYLVLDATQPADHIAARVFEQVTAGLQGAVRAGS